MLPGTLARISDWSHQRTSISLEAGYTIAHLAFGSRFWRFWSFIGLLWALYLSAAALPWSGRIVTWFNFVRDFNIFIPLQSRLDGRFLLSFYRNFTIIWFTSDIIGKELVMIGINVARIHTFLRQMHTPLPYIRPLQSVWNYNSKFDEFWVRTTRPLQDLHSFGFYHLYGAVVILRWLLGFRGSRPWTKYARFFLGMCTAFLIAPGCCQRNDTNQASHGLQWIIFGLLLHLYFAFWCGFFRWGTEKKAWAFRKQNMANTYGTTDLDAATIKGTSESELSTISADFFATRLLKI